MSHLVPISFTHTSKAGKGTQELSLLCYPSIAFKARTCFLRPTCACVCTHPCVHVLCGCVCAFQLPHHQTRVPRLTLSPHCLQFRMETQLHPSDRQCELCVRPVDPRGLFGGPQMHAQPLRRTLFLPLLIYKPLHRNLEGKGGGFWASHSSNSGWNVRPEREVPAGNTNMGLGDRA